MTGQSDAVGSEFFVGFLMGGYFSPAFKKLRASPSTSKSSCANFWTEQYYKLSNRYEGAEGQVRRAGSNLLFDRGVHVIL